MPEKKVSKRDYGSWSCVSRECFQFSMLIEMHNLKGIQALLHLHEATQSSRFTIEASDNNCDVEPSSFHKRGIEGIRQVPP